MAAQLKLTPSSIAERTTKTHVDTIEVTPKLLLGWKDPPFQRPLRVNNKVMDLAATLQRDGGVVPGVLTVGVLDGSTYLLDGQHRRKAFLIADVQSGYSDVRYHRFTTMTEMAEEFLNLNQALVTLRPDDILRALESGSEALQTIRQKCPRVGYDSIRRGTNSPIIGMSLLLRSWVASANDAPSSAVGSAANLGKTITTEDARHIIDFLGLAETAWGHDPEYFRLWGGMNMTLCMWLYRRLVLTAYSHRTQLISPALFQKCLMSLSAKSLYLEWLMGRTFGERDRSPCYSKIKGVFARRIEDETGQKPSLPAPTWAFHTGRTAK